MTTERFLLSAWNWNPSILAGFAAALALHARFVRGPGLTRRFACGIALVAIALLSPLAVLSAGVLFSAHMVQHLILLLIAPAVLLTSLPPAVSFHRRKGGSLGGSVPQPGPFPHIRWSALAGWLAGVGAMWIWHVPALCDAAASQAPIRGIQAASLLLMGAAFWWPVLAPREEDRLAPLPAVGYLFAACLACSALGILITLTPIQVCPIFCVPGAVGDIQELAHGGWGLTADRDRQLGGLLDVGSHVPRVPGRRLRAARPVVRVRDGPGGRAVTHDPNSPAGRSANPGAWKALPPEHLPEPTYWTPALGAAITFIFWGLIAGRVVLACGLVLFTVSLAGWIREIRNESDHPHE